MSEIDEVYGTWTFEIKIWDFARTPSPLYGWYPKFTFFVRHPCNLDITVSNIGLWSFSLQIPTAHGIIISRIYGISQIHSHPVEEVDTARENENYIHFICPKDWMLIQTTGQDVLTLNSQYLAFLKLRKGGMYGHCDFNESQVVSFWRWLITLGSSKQMVL